MTKYLEYNGITVFKDAEPVRYHVPGGPEIATQKFFTLDELPRVTPSMIDKYAALFPHEEADKRRLAHAIDAGRLTQEGFR